MVTRGCQRYIRSVNVSEFTAKVLREWLAVIAVKTAYIEPGGLRENGRCESYNARIRQEYLNEEQLGSLHEAKVLYFRWKELQQSTASWKLGRQAAGA